MPKPQLKQPNATKWDSDARLLAWLAACVSVFSFLFYYQHNDVMLYGDAVAHINIARRVFDSKTPGLLQLGTVWLPLPHLLMIPFLVSMKMWRTGAGGSIPSMAAFVFGAVGIFRLTRTALSQTKDPDGPSRAAAWIAAAIYAANPNLIYLQSTAMGEVLYLAFFLWAIVFLTEAFQGDAGALTKSGLCLTAACLTRYDGWFLAAAMVSIVVLDFLRGARSSFRRASAQRHGASESSTPVPRALHFSILKFVLLAAAGPALWLAYNGIIYRNPLEFENGPYSAKAIENRTQTASNPGHPGSGSPLASGLYFFKAAQDNVADNPWLQRTWIALLIAAALAGLLLLRAHYGGLLAWPLLFLLVPVPFYALSIAYGGVPIFIPQWWPFTHYNTRYGLQLLPAFAIAISVLAAFILRSARDRRLRAASIFALLAFAAASDVTIWRSGPITLQEAHINMRTRNQLERELASWLARLPSNATILMYLGDHVGALERAGIPLSHTINEGNHRVWKQPSDSQGLWERALADPHKYADYILAFQGDPVWQAVHNLHLPELVEIHVTGQAPAILYSAR